MIRVQPLGRSFALIGAFEEEIGAKWGERTRCRCDTNHDLDKCYVLVIDNNCFALAHAGYTYPIMLEVFGCQGERLLGPLESLHTNCLHFRAMIFMDYA